MAAGAFTSLASFSWASVSTGEPVVEHHELLLPQWDAEGLRLALLADLHTNSPMEVIHAQNAIRMALAEKPDILALAGDFINYGPPQFLEYLRQTLEPLREATCPVFASLGNHDYSCLNVDGVIEVLRASPATLLINESRDFEGVTIYGFDDAISGTHEPESFVQGNYSKSLIAMLHEPDFVASVPFSVSLQVSGHSHGGQICLPGGTPIHVPIGANNYSRGFYPDARVPLYVTRGIGTVGPRLRLFCPPEVSILTLRSA
jgi:predicted MPP superfamily phosphohydrolase